MLCKFPVYSVSMYQSGGNILSMKNFKISRRNSAIEHPQYTLANKF